MTTTMTTTMGAIAVAPRGSTTGGGRRRCAPVAAVGASTATVKTSSSSCRRRRRRAVRVVRASATEETFEYQAEVREVTREARTREDARIIIISSSSARARGKCFCAFPRRDAPAVFARVERARGDGGRARACARDVANA